MLVLTVVFGFISFVALLFAIPASRKSVLEKLYFLNTYEDSSPTLKAFAHLIEIAAWKKEFIGNKEIWICEKNNTYQIDASSEWRDFEENWTNVFPNKKAFLQPVILKINNTPIKELNYVFCDETRIFVPLPDIETTDAGKNFRYTWKKDSLSFKLLKVIGKYYIWKNIEEVAKLAKINIVK